VTPLEPRSLSAAEVGSLPQLALELLLRGWPKSLGLMAALAVLSEWASACSAAPISLLCVFAAGGFIMALGCLAARAAELGGSLVTLPSLRGLGRGLCLGLLLGVAYLAAGLPTTPHERNGPAAVSLENGSLVPVSLESDRPPVAVSLESDHGDRPHPVATLPDALRAVHGGDAHTVLAAGFAFAQERAAWISVAATLGVFLVVAAHIFGNGLAGGLTFVPLCLSGIPLHSALFLSRRAVSKNRAFLIFLFRRSPGVLLGLNATVILSVLAPDVIGLAAPLVILFVLYLGALCYVTHRAVFEGRVQNRPHRAGAGGRRGRPAAIAFLRSGETG